MHRSRLALAALAAALGGSAAAATGPGPIGTLMTGRYECELPGSAADTLRRPEASTSFTIASSSRYVAADGSVGTYLRTGDVVTMTSGPLAGTRLVVLRPAFLRRLEADGRPGTLRCVLSRSTDFED